MSWDELEKEAIRCAASPPLFDPRSSCDACDQLGVRAPHACARCAAAPCASGGRRIAQGCTNEATCGTAGGHGNGAQGCVFSCCMFSCFIPSV